MTTTSAAKKTPEKRSLSSDTIIHFKTFLDALSKDSEFQPAEDNAVRVAAAKRELEGILKALPNVATVAIGQIKREEERLQNFAEKALDETHGIFNRVKRNPITYGELWARLKIDPEHESDYSEKLEGILTSQPAQFVIEGDMIYRKRDEKGVETGVSLPGPKAKREYTKRQKPGPKPGAKKVAKKAAGKKKEDKSPDGTGFTRAAAKPIKEKTGVKMVTKGAFATIKEMLGSVKVDSASKNQLEEAIRKGKLKTENGILRS